MPPTSSIAKRLDDRSIRGRRVRSTSNTRRRGTSGFGTSQIDVEDVVAALARQLQDVAKTAGDDQRGARAAPLDERIRRERGAVHDLAYRGTRNAVPRQQLVHAVQHAGGEIVGAGQHLAGHHATGRSLQQHEIGERAADVDAQDAASALPEARALRGGIVEPRAPGRSRARPPRA